MTSKRDLIAADIASVCLRQMVDHNAQFIDVIMGQVNALIASLNTIKVVERARITALVCNEIQKRTN